MSNYGEKLKDPRWQKKRLEILADRGWACELCCESEKTLHVHHACYRIKAEPWEDPDQELRVLCEDCHLAEHDGQELEMTEDYILSHLGFTKQELVWIIQAGVRAIL